MLSAAEYFANRAFMLGRNFPGGVSLEIIVVILQGLVDEAKELGITISFFNLSEEFARGFNRPGNDDPYRPVSRFANAFQGLKE
jgi:hypothetical protein